MTVMINALESAVWLIGGLGISYAVTRFAARRADERQERR